MNFPTPLELLLDPATMIIITIYIGLYLWETILPRNKNLPVVKYSTTRGIVFFALIFYISSYLPILTDDFLIQFQFWDLTNLPLIVQVMIGLFCYQLFLYVWHKTMHDNDLLWRIFHQMHHSSERMDIPSTFYFSPVDMIGFTIMGSIVFALLIGVSAPAITAIILSLNFLSMFQHANISTPQWLGYFIQRPEQHAIHHEQGVHKYNYSDFPIYDWMFGTFNNPKGFNRETGFYNGASNRIKDMMLFRDVSVEDKS